MARAIDCEIAKKRLQAWIDESEAQGFEEAARNFRDCISLLDAVPTLTPPNEPLTIERLREMDGEPVWVELYQAWALVEVKQNGSVMFYGNSFSCSYSRTWQVYRFRPYRRPPEGEEDT